MPEGVQKFKKINMYGEKACLECGNITRKQDVCSRCRQKAQHEPREFAVPRSETNRIADEILATPKEEAEKDFEYWDRMWKNAVKEDSEFIEHFRYKRHQAFALINVEVIEESTLT